MEVLAQVIEMYSENGLDRPFFCTFATPWSGNVIRILNTGPMEYPLTASVVRPCWRVRFRHPASALEGKRVSRQLVFGNICEQMRCAYW